MKPLVVLAVTLLPLSLQGQIKSVERHNRTTIPSTRLQLLAQLVPSAAKAGSPVMINVTLKNTSQKTVRMGDSSPEFNYRIEVVDASGKEPPRTDWGGKLLRGEVFSLRQDILDLEPSKEEHALLDLTKVFQLTRPGIYFVRVDRAAIWTERDEDNDRFIETCYSNRMQLTVMP